MISFIRRTVACVTVMLAAAGFVAPLPALAQQDAGKASRNASRGEPLHEIGRGSRLRISVLGLAASQKLFQHLLRIEHACSPE